MSKDDSIIYGDDLPNPDLETDTWHVTAQMVYHLLVTGPWEDLLKNAQASLKNSPGNTEIVEIASLLMLIQEMMVESYEEHPLGREELEKMRNYTNKVGAPGVIGGYWYNDIEDDEEVTTTNEA